MPLIDGLRPRRQAVRAAVSAIFLVTLSVGPGAGMTAGAEPTPRTPDCHETHSASGRITLDCRPGFATSHDTVAIYRRTASSEPTDDAIWVFAVGATRAALIIDFHRTASTVVADVYDDRNGDGTVDYVIVDGVPHPLESQHPTVRVTSLDGWWTEGGRASFNLDIDVDGPVRASFGAGLGDPEIFNVLANDGRPDYRIHVRDRDQGGRPELEWRQFHPPFPENPALSEHYRSEVVSNPEDDEFAVTGHFLWPYLAVEPRPVRQYTKDYEASPPPIQVDWARGRIVQVAEFVASRGNPGSFFIYSINRIREGSTTATNFENPFAFYDFADARDGWPDTSIRFVALLPGEADDVPNTDPINMVMYTWDQEHAHSWTYSLNLVGNQTVEDTIDFGEFAVKAVPPSRLPGWVADQEWTAATFVEVTKPYWTSEHVYEYTPDLSSAVLPYRYLTGLTDTPPTTTFEEIAPGFRGEYAFELDAPARLYVNPIDLRLHLHGAERGVWNMGSDGELRYGNLGGPYVDHWSFTDRDGDEQELYWAADRLVYISRDDVRVGRFSLTQVPALVAPPTDAAEWARLRDLMAAHRPEFAPGNLLAMFERLATSVERLPAGRVAGFRLTDEGFRFILTPGASDRSWPSASPGDPQAPRLVTYTRERGLAVTAARPAVLDFGRVNVVGGRAQASATSELALDVRNTGDVDAVGVRVTLEAALKGEAYGGIGSLVVDVPGGEASRASVLWTPTRDGQWLIVPRTGRQSEPGEATLIAVEPAPETGPAAVMRVDDIPGHLYLLASLALAGAAVLAGELLGGGRPGRSRRGVGPVATGSGNDPSDG